MTRYVVTLAADSHLYFPIFYAKATKCTGWDKVELRVAPAPEVDNYCISDDRIFSDLLGRDNKDNILAFCDPMRWLWAGSATSYKPCILGTFINRNPLLVRGSIPKRQAADFKSTFDEYHIGISQLLVHPRGMSGFNSALYALWNSDFVKQSPGLAQLPLELEQRIEFAKARFSKQGFPPALNPIENLESLRKTYVQRQDEVQTAYLTEDILDSEHLDIGKQISTFFDYSTDTLRCNTSFTSLVTSRKFIEDSETSKILEELRNGLIHALKLIYSPSRSAEEIARKFQEKRNWRIGLTDLGETEIAKLVSQFKQRHSRGETIHSVDLASNQIEWNEARKTVAFSVALDEHPNNLVNYEFQDYTHNYPIGTGTNEDDGRSLVSQTAHRAGSSLIRLFKPSSEKFPWVSILLIFPQLVIVLVSKIPKPIGFLRPPEIDGLWLMIVMCFSPGFHLVLVSRQLYHLKRQLDGHYGKPVTFPQMKIVMGAAYVAAVLTAICFNDKNGPDWLGIFAAPIIAFIVVYLKKARGVNLIDIFTGMAIKEASSEASSKQ